MTMKQIGSMIVRAMLGGALAVLAGGCGQRLPPTVPVSGKVTWQGKALTDGTVVFQPHVIAEGLPRRPATGQLDAEGRYRLTTFRAGDGAVPGKYHVTVHSYLSEPGQMKDDIEVVEYTWRIPEMYGDPARSGLSATVPARSDPLTLDFHLKEP